MKVRGRKNGIIHEVTTTSAGPHRVRDREGQTITVEGMAYWFLCTMWAREAAIDVVDDAVDVTCIGCMAVESGVDLERDR